MAGPQLLAKNSRHSGKLKGLGYGGTVLKGVFLHERGALRRLEGF